MVAVIVLSKILNAIFTFVDWLAALAFVAFLALAAVYGGLSMAVFVLAVFAAPAALLVLACDRKFRHR
jgi:hypothetical protein